MNRLTRVLVSFLVISVLWMPSAFAVSLTLTCPNSVTLTVNYGIPPTAGAETITCTINTDDADNTVPVVYSGNIDGSNHVLMTHTNSVDTLNVLLDNPGGAATGSIPNLSVAVTTSVDTDFTFDATIDNLDNASRAGSYTTLSPLVLTATAF